MIFRLSALWELLAAAFVVLVFSALMGVAI